MGKSCLLSHFEEKNVKDLQIQAVAVEEKVAKDDSYRREMDQNGDL